VAQKVVIIGGGLIGLSIPRALTVGAGEMR